jgi:hypothetical protein
MGWIPGLGLCSAVAAAAAVTVSLPGTRVICRTAAQSTEVEDEHRICWVRVRAAFGTACMAHVLSFAPLELLGQSSTRHCTASTQEGSHGTCSVFARHWGRAALGTACTWTGHTDRPGSWRRFECALVWLVTGQLIQFGDGVRVLGV